jgi:hypothetical protein
MSDKGKRAVAGKGKLKHIQRPKSVSYRFAQTANYTCSAIKILIFVWPRQINALYVQRIEQRLCCFWVSWFILQPLLLLNFMLSWYRWYHWILYLYYLCSLDISLQAIGPELTFYNTSKDVEESPILTSQLLHAQLDAFCRSVPLKCLSLIEIGNILIFWSAQCWEYWEILVYI